MARGKKLTNMADQISAMQGMMKPVGMGSTNPMQVSSKADFQSAKKKFKAAKKDFKALKKAF